MATLEWPESLVPAKATWGLKSNTEGFNSPLNGSVQTVERPGARWKITLEFPPKNERERGQLEAFLASIGGLAGRFTIWPHGRPGNSMFAPLVNGSMTNFKMLPTKSWPASTLVLRAGDYLAVGGELKIVTADVTSSAGGLATVPVAPPFRNAPTNNAAITLDKPRTTMMLTADEYGVPVLPGRISDSVVISASEVF
ncbi:hypothetical protein [Cupriavidus campinensis]|jgi:hypothetical protein|uniref:hypothetical protein n=1 Tax=Cupriavidus campinensis TaxID=151783 RepID=UPI0024E26444|nr:hypothetical protein [Cupriavidus campinensis]